MQLGIHLPQAGEQARPELIRRAAMRAEELGLGIRAGFGLSRE